MQIAPKKHAGFNRDAPEAQKCRKILKIRIFMMMKIITQTFGHRENHPVFTCFGKAWKAYMAVQLHRSPYPMRQAGTIADPAEQLIWPEMKTPMHSEYIKHVVNLTSNSTIKSTLNRSWMAPEGMLGA